MIELSNTLQHIQLSPSVAMHARALEMRRAGREVIALSAGELDFDTPEHIREAAARAIADGKTRYTPIDGIGELKEAIVAKLRQDNGIDVGTNQVSVSAGAKQAIYNALRATLNPGDEVIVPAPYWTSYPDMVRLCGGQPVIVNTDDRFKLQPDALEKAISKRTRWIIINSPCNPSGAVYGAADLRALADVLKHHTRVCVLSDDIYEHIVYEPAAFSTMAAAAPDLAERTLTVNGVSKTFAMTGFRVGYAAGPATLIGAMRVVQSQSSGNPCSISQWAALAALREPADFLPGFLRTLEQRRDGVVSSLNDIDGIECPTPDGAFYVYPSITGCLGATTPAGARLETDEDFASALLAEEAVALVHGAAFGNRSNIRISYAASDADLVEACTRIARFCRSLKHGG